MDYLRNSEQIKINYMSLTTVNIEKKLLRENKKLATPQELLVIKEYERIGEVDDFNILNRVGIEKNISAGRSKKSEIDRLRNETLKFDQSRVFHISQIESICNKYYLKFLPSYRFRGSIDKELPQKLTTFEVAHNVGLNSYNSYIVAPSKAFELQERPKDPLFFYKINNEYYYLIHKWGNDLNIFRRFLPLLSTVWFTVVSLFIALFTAPILLGILLNPNFFILISVSVIIFVGFCINRDTNKGRVSFIPKNDFQSEFRDGWWG